MIRLMCLCRPGWKGWLAGLLWLMSAHVLAAELSLPDLLSGAAHHHPSVRLRQSELRAAQSELAGASWSRYPSFGTEVATAKGGAQAVAKLQQPLWTGGRIESQIALAQSMVSAREAAVQEAQLAIMLEAAGAFFECLRFSDRRDAALANEQEHRRLLEIIERRVKAEVSPATDATQAKARLQQAISERLTFERQLDGQRSRLQQILGVPPGPLRPPQSIRLEPWNLASLRDAAFRYSPQLSVQSRTIIRPPMEQMRV
ncbi:MAG: hypothetical protein E6Q49_02215 [Limnohabitans sp.]|nr:MAG: hypothetical protein E6Q49_02215 [Limnohabitans sp.]